MMVRAGNEDTVDRGLFRIIEVPMVYRARGLVLFSMFMLAIPGPRIYALLAIHIQVYG